MEPVSATEGRAAVTYPAPHGVESLVLADGDVARFGRGGSCEIRFGYAPVADTGVPREAGRLVVAAQRVFVESLAEPGRRSMEVSASGRPPMLLGIGDGFAPAEPEFRVVVYGGEHAWVLSVVVRRDRPLAVPASEPPTQQFELELTAMQRRVVRAYVDPLRRGRLEPATHREVGAALAYHPNTAREALYEAWARMFAAGIPMPDVADKRVAVVEAVRLHRLLDVDDDEGYG